ncbi:MAG: hypothetical protein HYU36_17085 [Planctomycetes bacterium]|nr:hypothetical protein [Planctomycetota bacterium]
MTEKRRRCLPVVGLAVLAIGPTVRAQPAAHSEESQAPPRMLFLSRQEPYVAGPSSRQGLLLREIIRQAVLIAARDGLGLATHDETLGENVEAAGDLAGCGLDVFTLAVVGEYLGVRIRLMDAAREDWAYEKLLSVEETDETRFYFQVLERAEAASRGEFVELLKRLGFEGKPNRANPETGLPEQMEQQIGRLSFTAQFTALRALHDAQRRLGESPSTLGGLVRAYAHLGQLTHFHWNAAHKAYAARALLYAQRMVATDPGAPGAYEHRAYALALAGFHAGAMADIALARALVAAADPVIPAAALPEEAPSERPGEAARSPVSWVPFIEAYCRYDVTLLSAEKADPALQELVAFLHFLTREHDGSSQLKTKAGTTLIRKNPECLMIYDSLSHDNDIGVRSWAVYAALQGLEETLTLSLPGIPGLPVTVAIAVQDYRTSEASRSSKKIMNTLERAGSPHEDPDEPSWSLLGRMLEDSAFAQVCRQLHFLRFSAGSSLPEMRARLNSLHPWLEHHPYRPYPVSLTVHPQNEKERYRDLLTHLEIRDSCLSMLPLVHDICSVERPEEPRGSKEIYRLAGHVDPVVRDLEDVIEYYWQRGPSPIYREISDAERERIDKLLVQSAHRLRQTSPSSPIPCPVLLEKDRGSVEEEVPEWEDRYRQFPGVIDALALAYWRSKRYDDAVRCYRRVIEIAPDGQAYQNLGHFYRVHNHIEKWMETMEEYLRVPDEGLGHEQVRTELAGYYMKKKQWDQAVVHAEIAAQSGAAWAMGVAAECYENMGEWKKAETWRSRISQAYENQAAEWYLWCHRTGRGDAETAYQCLQEAANPSDRGATKIPPQDIGVSYLLRKDFPKALKFFQNHMVEKISPWWELHAALTAHELGKHQLRDEALQKALAKKDKAGEHAWELGEMFRMVEIYQEALATGKADRAALDKVWRTDHTSLEDLLYFAGSLLLIEGDAKAGLDYLKRSAGSDHHQNLAVVLSLAAVRQHGVRPEEIEEAGRLLREENKLIEEARERRSQPKTAGDREAKQKRLEEERRQREQEMKLKEIEEKQKKLEEERQLQERKLQEGK